MIMPLSCKTQAWMRIEVKVKNLISLVILQLKSQVNLGHKTNLMHIWKIWSIIIRIFLELMALSQDLRLNFVKMFSTNQRVHHVILLVELMLKMAISNIPLALWALKINIDQRHKLLLQTLLVEKSTRKTQSQP
jgi:hypothetical protein